MILHDKALIHEYTEAGLWGQRTLIDEIEDQAQAHAGRLAVVDPPDRPELVGSPPRDKSWEQIAAAVDAVAAQLQRLGLVKDDIVVIHLPNVWELLVLYFAVSKAGGIPSPLPMQWRQHELGHVAGLTGARFYVAADNFKGAEYLPLVDKIEGGHCIEHRIGLGQISAWAENPADAGQLSPVDIDANDIFTLCWTSGTESLPKGTPLSHNNWFFQAKRVLGLLDVRDGDRLLCVAPVVNMTGVGVMLLPWVFRAATLIMHHPLNLELFLKQLTESDVQFSILVPAMLNMIVKLPNVDELDLSHLRTVATGSAPPSAFALEEFQRRWGIEISNLWGQNEGTALVAGPQDVPELKNRVDHMPWWGRKGVDWPSAIPGLQVKIVGEDGKNMSEPDAVGEIAYRGPNLFPGYYKRPDVNEKSFDDEGFFYTGDNFKILDECFISFFDRKKDIIIRGGFNISAAEIENLVQAHPQVGDAAAISQPDDVMGEKVCLCIVPKQADQAPPGLEDITGWMRARGIASYKLPEHLRIVEVIPRNPVGKILKRELREQSVREGAHG